MNSNNNFIKIKLPLKTHDPDLLSWALINSGAAGTQVVQEDGSNYIIAFLPEESDQPTCLCNTNNVFSVFLEKLSSNKRFIPDLDKLLLEMQTGKIAGENWKESWKQGIKPIATAGFYLLPSWNQNPDHIPKGKIPLWVDHAQAFGTGMHSTTRLCLDLLVWLRDHDCHPEKILDIGCGTGILGIAAQKIWNNSSLFFVDNDKEALQVTKRVLQLNGLENTNIYQVFPKNESDFDLILANISTPVLVELKSQILSRVQKEGKLLFSGVNTQTRQSFEQAYGSNYIIKRSRKEWFGYLY
ncbi:MAG: 50S ribosomal protein L11 methyltransferase [Deltaproteobacteria bacterium]|jgi:ribosomal protein L11 methyltransferase|nr:50S ribosomal protein L11 methyltransferase [Deltaproteobacteria bacterium]